MSNVGLNVESSEGDSRDSKAWLISASASSIGTVVPIVADERRIKVCVLEKLGLWRESRNKAVD